MLLSGLGTRNAVDTVDDCSSGWPFCKYFSILTMCPLGMPTSYRCCFFISKWYSVGTPENIKWVGSGIRQPLFVLLQIDAFKELSHLWNRALCWFGLNLWFILLLFLNFIHRCLCRPSLRQLVSASIVIYSRSSFCFLNRVLSWLSLSSCNQHITTIFLDSCLRSNDASPLALLRVLLISLNKLLWTHSQQHYCNIRNIINSTEHGSPQSNDVQEEGVT